MSDGRAAMRRRTCGRFRAHRDGDRFCIGGGCETLDTACAEWNAC